PAEGPQVNVRLVQLATLEDAQEAKARLDAGEEMVIVAATDSIHASKSRAGDLGWVAKGTFPPEVEEVVFDQPVETTTDIIETEEEGFYLVEVRAAETRPIEGTVRDSIINRQMGMLVRGVRADLGSE